MEQKICRICLGTESLRDIFQKCETESFSVMTMGVSRVKIYPKDGLPNYICYECVLKLKECYKFKLQCEKSDAKLKTLYLSKSTSDLATDKVSITGENEFIESISEKSDNELNYPEPKIAQVTQKETETSQNVFKKKNRTKTSAKEQSRKLQKQQCFTCGKVMSSRFRLNTHLKIHTGEKPFRCSHCNKTFSLEQYLKVHLRTHSGEKPLCCTVCGDSFAHSSGLIVHSRKHTGELPYQCTLCPRRFRTTGHLRYHTRRHTGEKNFECDTCGRAFITRSDLKQHSQIHTGDKPHVCSICGFRVTRSWHLKRHMSIHHKKKLFQCPDCSTKFLEKKDLNEHIKKHSSQKM